MKTVHIKVTGDTDVVLIRAFGRKSMYAKRVKLAKAIGRVLHDSDCFAGSMHPDDCDAVREDNAKLRRAMSLLFEYDIKEGG